MYLAKIPSDKPLLFDIEGEKKILPVREDVLKELFKLVIIQVEIFNNPLEKYGKTLSCCPFLWYSP